MRAWCVSAPSCLGIRPFWPDVLTCIHGTETRYGGDCRRVLGAAMLPICCKRSGLTLRAPSLPAANLRLRKSYQSETTFLRINHLLLALVSCLKMEHSTPETKPLEVGQLSRSADGLPYQICAHVGT